jgi:hypothetical protein
MSDGQANVALEGDVVVARISGEPTESLLRTTQEQVIGLVRAAGQGRVLYDTLAMTPPPVAVPWSQRILDETLGPIRLKRAIVVPDTRLAYLARLAFGEGDYRVFYEDRAAALRWLTDADA